MSLLRHRDPGVVDLGHLQRLLDQEREHVKKLGAENAHLRERNHKLAWDKDYWHGESRRLAGELANLRAERDELFTMLHGERES